MKRATSVRAWIGIVSAAVVVSDVTLAQSNDAGATHVQTASSASAAPERALVPSNAALVYWRVWAEAPADLSQKVDETFNGRDLAWSPQGDSSAALLESQAYIASIIEATTIESCDWGLEYAKGPQMHAPHFEKLRATSRVLVADCRRAWSEGRADDAVTRTIALFRMAKQTRQGELMMTSSLAQGFARMAADEVIRMAAPASGAGSTPTRLNDAQRTALLGELRPLVDGDPFKFADAMRNEGRVARAYITSTFKGAEAGRSLLRALARGGEPDTMVSAIIGLDEAGLARELEKVRAYFDAAAEAWMAPPAPPELAGPTPGGSAPANDSVTRLRALEVRLTQGEFSQVALLVAPGFSPARMGADEQREIFKQALRALEAK